MRHVFAGYWIAWRIVFESDEQIIAVPAAAALLTTAAERERRDPGEAGRYPAFYRSRGDKPAAAYVFLAGSAREHRSRRRLARRGLPSSPDRRLHRLRAAAPCVACEGEDQQKRDKDENDVSREQGPEMDARSTRSP